MSRRDVLAALACAAGVGPVAASAAPPDRVRNTLWHAGGLAGTLTAPAGGPARGLGVLILAGSGPTDRDGNGPFIATDLYRQIAESLADAGYASLRIDKRGVGASQALGGREEDLRFSQYVDDAAAAARSLAARPGLHGVVLLGHSEGGLVAIEAAPEVPAAGLVLLAAPGRPLGAVLDAQFATAGLPPALASEAAAILDALSAGRTVAEVSPALAAAFRPSVQPYLISLMGIDPAAELKRRAVPTLLVTAGRDIQVSAEDAAALAAARPDARQVTLADANHVFKAAPADRAGNIALYTQPAAPLHPGLMPALLAFLGTLDTGR